MRVCVALVLLLPATVFGQPENDLPWQVHDDSSLEFVAVQQGAEFTGRFEQFEATIRFDPAAPQLSSLAIAVVTDSVNTYYDDRDEVLRGPDLLNVERWPEATFSSDSVRVDGESRFVAAGDLTIRDRTQPLALPFSFENRDGQTHLSGEITISRLDFGVGQGEWSNTEWVGADVKIRFRLRLESPYPAGERPARQDGEASK